jgi:hypothetical protein
MPKEFPPPTHLSEKSRELWREIVPKRAKSVGRLTLLTAALEALDRAEQCRIELAGADLTTTTASTGAVHLHPLLKLEREQKQLFAKLWNDLHLGWDGLVDGRYPGATQ